MPLNWSSKLESTFSSLLGSGSDASTKAEALQEAVREAWDVEEASSADWPVDATKQPTAVQDPVSAESESSARLRAEESALIAQAKLEPGAFGVLYERYVDRVYAYIFHRLSNPHEAEDLTARTFYRALSRLHTYEDRGIPFSAWLFRIAHNLVANWHRDHSRRSFLSLERIWSHSRVEETPEVQLEQEETHDALWDAIDRLPEERRNLLLYKFSSRLSNVEIGELMNKSESAIKSLYFRTLAALRQDLESREWE